MRALQCLISATLVVAVVSSAASQTKWLIPAELKTTFSGKTINGEYPGGRAFIERYNADGTLQYDEPNVTSRGKWSIKGGMFCTFYDTPGMGGGCFMVTRAPTNCIEYYQVANHLQLGGKPPVPAQDWGARGVLAGEKGSCVSAQSV